MHQKHVMHFEKKIFEIWEIWGGGGGQALKTADGISWDKAILVLISDFFLYIRNRLCSFGNRRRFSFLFANEIVFFCVK